MKDHHVQIIRGAISPALCDALIGMHRHAFLHGGTHRIEEAWRRCTVCPFPSDVLGSAALFDAFQKELKPHLDGYKKDYATLSFCDRIERPSVISYDPRGAEEEHFHEHADAWDINTATRAVSVILYLNDVEEGGETVFPGLDHSSKPEQGKLLLFPSYFTHQHMALRPKSEKKFVVVAWIHFGNGGTPKLDTLPLL